MKNSLWYIITSEVNLTPIIIFFAIVMIIALSFIGYSIYKQKKFKNERKMLANNSYFDCNGFANNNINLIRQITSETEPIRNHFVSKYRLCKFFEIAAYCVAFAPVLILFFPSIFENQVFIYIICGVVVLGLVFAGISGLLEAGVEREYREHFSSKIVPNIIKLYNPKLVYNPTVGYSKEEYENCWFYESSEIFGSNDSISDMESNFFYADVSSEIEVEVNNHTRRAETFSGSLARVPIPNCNSEIYLGSIPLTNSKNGEKLIPLKLESETFNNLFKIMTNNEMQAYKILTPDVLEEFAFLKQNVIGDIDIRILNDFLYIRFRSGNGFAGSLHNSKEEEVSIISSIAALDIAIKTTNNVKMILEKKLK